MWGLRPHPWGFRPGLSSKTRQIRLHRYKLIQNSKFLLNNAVFFRLRSELRSCGALEFEQNYPCELLHPQDAPTQHRIRYKTSRTKPRKRGKLVQFSQLIFHHLRSGLDYIISLEGNKRVVVEGSEETSLLIILQIERSFQHIACTYP